MSTACHVIWSTYGSWLPSPPRCGWHNFIATWELATFGQTQREPHGPLELAPSQYHINRELALRALKYPAVHLDAVQSEAMGEAFQRYFRRHHVPLEACAIMPQCVQMVIPGACPNTSIFINKLRGQATTTLMELNIHPLQAYREQDGQMPKMWSHNAWRCPLESDSLIHQAIDYVHSIQQSSLT